MTPRDRDLFGSTVIDDAPAPWSWNLFGFAALFVAIAAAGWPT